MADDPYSVLGVSRTASDDEIRSAFRKLAKQLHPDVNPGDKSASERFKKVTAANDIVGDPEKRRQYDRGEIDGQGEPRRTYASQGAGRASRGGSGFEDPFTDIFEGIFGRASRTGPGASGAAQRGRDVRYTLEVEFLESVLGARKRVAMPNEGMLDIHVPEGTTDGQVLRLKGKGSPGFGQAEAGDALVEIKVKPHAQFTRAGDDILSELPVTIDEAVLGARIEVATAGGRVAVNVPKGTSSGQVLRLKGKGVRNPATGQSGDQLVTVRIVLPDVIDEDLSYFMQQWRLNHRYDPRRS